VKTYQAPADPTQIATSPLTSYGCNYNLFGGPGAITITTATGGAGGNQVATPPGGAQTPRWAMMFSKGTTNIVIVAERYAVAGISAAGNTGASLSHFWNGANNGYFVGTNSGSVAAGYPMGTSPNQVNAPVGFQLAPSQSGAEDLRAQGFSGGGMCVALGDASCRLVSSGVTPTTWAWANDYTYNIAPPSNW